MSNYIKGYLLVMIMICILHINYDLEIFSDDLRKEKKNMKKEYAKRRF